jgi:hypothetical protein
MEEIQEHEKETMARLQHVLFDKTKQIDSIHKKNEVVVTKNNELEAEFESEITRHNDD